MKEHTWQGGACSTRQQLQQVSQGGLGAAPPATPDIKGEQNKVHGPANKPMQATTGRSYIC
jgi:hypothetical protein